MRQRDEKLSFTMPHATPFFTGQRAGLPLAEPAPFAKRMDYGLVDLTRRSGNFEINTAVSSHNYHKTLLVNPEGIGQKKQLGARATTRPCVGIRCFGTRSGGGQQYPSSRKQCGKVSLTLDQPKAQMSAISLADAFVAESKGSTTVTR